MKNLRKLVPQEEIDALFREVYSTKEEKKEDYFSETSPISKKHKILGYKIKKLIKISFLSILPVKMEIKNYRFINSINNISLLSVGFDLEGKYRLYISVDENIFDILESVFKKNSLIVNENENAQKVVEKFLEDVGNRILNDVEMKKRKIYTTQLVFYEDDVSHIQYEVEIEDVRLNLFVSFDEFLLDTVEVKPIIFSTPTNKGKKSLEALKKRTYIKILYETKKIDIESSELYAGNEITIKKIEIKRRMFI